jgi:long-chain acyl-CoA synthetase
MEKIWLNEYPEGVPYEINIDEYQSLLEILERSFIEYSERPAFYNMGTTITFKELDELSKRFASYLQNDLCLKKGERVAIMMPNILQYPVVLFGCLRAGIVVVNVNPLYTTRELQHQLKDSGARAIVIFENSASVLEKCLGKTDIKHVIVTEIGDMLKFPKNIIINFVIRYVKKMIPEWDILTAVTFKDAIKNSDPRKYVRPKLSHEDIAFLQYTGGTTGVSKGAVLLHKNILSNLLQAKSWIGARNAGEEEGREIIITPLPLYHIFSLTANCFVFSSIGALNVLITNPKDIDGFIKELKKWKFTAFTGVNTLFNALVNRPEFQKIDFSHLKVTLGGGMAVQRTVAEKWKGITGSPLIEAYGLTETSPAACVNPLTIPDYNGKIGVPIPSTEIVIKDDEEKTLSVDEIGEICIKGPQVMKGYWNRPEETKAAFTYDGFFKTGDIGFMDDKGYFKIVDRKKDMILVSGFNVFPNEIEEVVSTHPKVFECAVVGKKDEKSGEIVKVFVVKSEPDLSKDELIAFCRDNISHVKSPRSIDFEAELPRHPTGKLYKRLLKDKYWGEKKSRII